FGNHTKVCCSLQTETKRCDSAAFTKAHRSQQLAQKLKSASGVALVQLLADFPDVEIAISHQLRRNLKRAGAGFWILKRARIRRDCSEEIFRNVVVKGQALALGQSENDFCCRGGVWVNDHQIPIAGIDDMMVDVDPDFCPPDGGERRAQPVL